ncbi:hypothetical protein [Paraherbaspirillum soli]|uniref:Uncharacterized protein n=1 Tax=Paraherbaspirillum soli TaxID=631222 RepID=A0ABW0MD18_9BURK
MIRISCRNTTLSELSNLYSVESYEQLVHPLDYEFDLIRDAIYVVLGVLVRHGTSWLYVAALNGNQEIQIVPAALFSFTWSQVPTDWTIRITNDRPTSLELLPFALAQIDRWYEHYVDGDETVISLVQKEFKGIN